MGNSDQSTTYMMVGGDDGELRPWHYIYERKPNYLARFPGGWPSRASSCSSSRGLLRASCHHKRIFIDLMTSDR